MILGTSKLKPVDPMKMVSIGVKDIIMHPKFWGRTFTTSDIALLQLHDPAVFSKYVQPICLPEPTYRLKVGTQCWEICCNLTFIFVVNLKLMLL